MRARRQETSRVVRQAAAVCLGYPERDVIATSGLLRAALAESAPRETENFEPLLAPTGTPQIYGRFRLITSMFSIFPASTASTCRTGQTGTPGGEARS